MLDWTTSFLSDETIIKPRSKSVKHFLVEHNRRKRAIDEPLPVDCGQEKCPAFLRGIDENQEATPVALEDQPYCGHSKAIRTPVQVVCQIAHNSAEVAIAIPFLEGSSGVILRESVGQALQ